MSRSFDEEERHVQDLITRQRQGALFFLGVSLLVLWMLPHPHGGVYQFVSGNVMTTGGFPELNALRKLTAFAGWASVVAYVLMPLYVRMKTRS